jgi:hypothetical protein
MMNVAWAPLVVALIGLAIWRLAEKDAKTAEAGKILFTIGALWFVYLIGGKTTHI